MSVFKVGKATVTRIEETYLPIYPAAEIFPALTETHLAEHAHWLSPPHYDPASGKIKLSVHSWLLQLDGRKILIDGCCGNQKSRPLRPHWNMLNEPWLDRLAAAGARPDEIDLVMCTHLHVDHVGWNTQLKGGKWVPTFPNAKYVMSRTDHAHWAALAKKFGTEAYQVNTYNDSVLPVVEARKAEFVSGEHAMCGCFKLKPTPGHTPGQMRVDLESKGKRAIFAGDALHNPVQVPLWKWNSVFCEDRDLARQSRNTLLGD